VRSLIPKTIPQRVQEMLKYYVYLYLDPRDGKVFYIGKGKGERILSHLNDPSDTEKTGRIRELREVGCEPRLEILRYGLESEHEALLVESTAIDLLDVSKLTNLVRGHGSGEHGRSQLEDLVHELKAEEAKISERVLLVNINQRYRYGMTDQHLYESTRGIWKLMLSRAETVEYAFAVYRGIVREVYRTVKWLPAGSTQYFSRAGEDLECDDRYEFVGRIADEPVRNKYRGKSVKNQWTQGAQNPIKYVNC